MDPGVIEMLSKVDSAAPVSKKGAGSLQDLFVQMQDEMNQQITLQNQSQFQSDPNQQRLGDQFNALMDADINNIGTLSTPDSVAYSPSVIGTMLTQQDMLLKNTLNNLSNFQNNMSHGNMSLDQVVSQAMEVSGSVATYGCNAALHLAAEQSSKHSFDTLLKNQ